MASPEFAAWMWKRLKRFNVDVYLEPLSPDRFHTVEVLAANPIHAQLVARNAHGAIAAMRPREVAAKEEEHT